MSVKKFFLILLFSVATILAAQKSRANPIVVVVMDTGFTQSTESVPLCKHGLMDFTLSGDPEDLPEVKHGSNIIGLISKQTKLTNYCVVSLKVFRSEAGLIRLDTAAYIAALNYVLKTKPPILNLSMAGYDLAYPNEIETLKQILDGGTTIVASAGNNYINFNTRGCIVYPACADKRIIVVGASDTRSSNKGRIIDLWESGKDQTAGGTTLTGTSQATAVATGKILDTALKEQKKRESRRGQ